MDYYLVSSGKVDRIKSLEQFPDAFTLIFFSNEEWGIILHKIAAQESSVSMQALEKIKQIAVREQDGNEEDIKLYAPFFQRLTPSLVFVSYRDIDEYCREYPVAFFIAKGYIAFLETPSLSVRQVKEWAEGGLMKTTADLAQFLGFQTLEHYQQCLEKLEDRIDDLGESILNGPRRWQQAEIVQLHKRVISLKKSLNAHEKVFNRLAVIDRPNNWRQVAAETQRGLENARQTHELVENLREAYQTAMDNRTNDIMKILTLLATILLPINLLTGFFGMNFENMPLVNTTFGIYVFYLISLLIAVFVITLFWHKRWLK